MIIKTADIHCIVEYLESKAIKKVSVANSVLHSVKKLTFTTDTVTLTVTDDILYVYMSPSIT